MNYKAEPPSDLKSLDMLERKPSKLQDLSVEYLDSDYVCELLNSFQDTENEKFIMIKDIIIRLLKSNGLNAVSILKENDYFSTLFSIFYNNPNEKVFITIITIINTIFSISKKDPSIINLLPVQIFEELIKILKSSQNLVFIYYVLSCFITLLTANTFTEKLFEMDILKISLELYSNLFPEAEFQGINSLESDIISEILSIYYLFLANFDKQRIPEETAVTMIDQFSFWIMKNEVCDNLFQSLKGFDEVSAYDIQIIDPYTHNPDFMNQMYKYLRLTNECIVT